MRIATSDRTLETPPRRAMNASQIGLEGIRPVRLGEIKKRVMRGEVIVVRECLQAIGWLERLEAASLTGIRNSVGDAVASRVAEKGLPLFHEAIDPDDLATIMRSLYEHYRPLTPALARDVLHRALGIEDGFYYEEAANVRFHVPFDIAAQSKDKQELIKDWSGKVTPHCPHHDSWYQCPANAFNVWIAVSPVKPGNGLMIFPEMFGKRLPCTQDGRMLADQFLGRPLTFSLDAGDALIFHGEHLHSSEINVTMETRHVVSLRLTLNEPRFYGPSNARFVYSPAPRTWRNEVAESWKRLRATFGSAVGASQRLHPVPPFDDTSARFPKTFDYASLDDGLLKVGEMRPVSKQLCAARLEPDRIVLFQRHCPHEGADLAGGHLRDGSVVCPWHNLPIDLETGASPCRSLRKIKVTPYLRGDPAPI